MIFRETIAFFAEKNRRRPESRGPGVSGLTRSQDQPILMSCSSTSYMLADTIP